MTEGQSRRIAFSFPATPASISDVRHLILSEANTLPFSIQDLDDIALAVSEAFTNLVQYAHGYRIRGVCAVENGQLEIRFEVDHALADHLYHRVLPAATAFGGRGIPLLHMLFPTVEIRHDASVDELRLVKPVSHKESDDETHISGGR